MHSNKSIFSVDADVLNKEYIRNGNALRDYELLSLIEKSFHHVKCGGWCYRPLRVFQNKNQSSNILIMERVHSENLRDAFSRTGDARLFRHAGCWLGLLHAATNDASGSVLTFNDFNRSNVLLDWDKQEVIAIDPGEYRSVRSRPGISLVVGACSILRGVILKRIALVPSALLEYIGGYMALSGRKSDPSLWPGVSYLWWRFYTGRSQPVLDGPAVLRGLVGGMECMLLFLVIKACLYKLRWHIGDIV